MKTVQIFKTAIAAATLVLASGCASIVTDSTTAINVQTSNGQKVKVSMEGRQFDVPGIIVADKNGLDKMLVVENNEQCQTGTTVPKKIEGWFWGNILSGGFFGSTTDSSTDKMWTYQDTVVINCTSN